jgi:hypothetical protein
LLDPEDLAKGLGELELLEKCTEGIRKLKDAIPYLREARDRFSQPGRRVPVAGNPTWTGMGRKEPRRSPSAACSGYEKRQWNLAKQFRPLPGSSASSVRETGTS